MHAPLNTTLSASPPLAPSLSFQLFFSHYLSLSLSPSLSLRLSMPPLPLLKSRALTTKYANATFSYRFYNFVIPLLDEFFYLFARWVFLLICSPALEGHIIKNITNICYLSMTATAMTSFHIARLLFPKLWHLLTNLKPVDHWILIFVYAYTTTEACIVVHSLISMDWLCIHTHSISTYSNILCMHISYVFFPDKLT